VARRLLALPLATLAPLLPPAPPATAAPPPAVSIDVAPEAGVRLGRPVGISGRVTLEGAPAAMREVALEVKRYPYTGAWRTASSGRTAADGRYVFSPELARNHEVRVRVAPLAQQPGGVSPKRRAYVLPAFRLAFAPAGPGRVRLRQTYTVPHGVRLTARTRFYLGRRSAERVRLRTTAATRRLRAGRFEALAVIRVPPALNGRFRYASCFPYSPGSGMGDPAQRCPPRFQRVG